MAEQFIIVGLGEALFDIFADRQVLGGAPLNAAVHAHQLVQLRGGGGVVVSRVGQDELGRRVLSELAQRGMATDYVQADPDHKTGRVYVSVDETGQPDYEIVEEVAWDWIQWDPDVEELARRCDAVCFSGLAQRHSQSRSSVQRFLAEARRAVRMFDLTLRQHYYDAQMLRRSCELANVVKLNLEELDVLADQVQLAGDAADDKAEALRRRFDLKSVVLTRGAQGTVIFTESQRYEGEPVSYDRQEGADNVGAGDACSAAVLVGMVLRLPMATILELANHAGAYVASVPGATPALAESILERLK